MKPTCPMCSGTNLKKIEDKLYRCGKCNMLTDGIDDGTVGHGRPENNASRNEEFEQRQKARRRRTRRR